MPLYPHQCDKCGATQDVYRQLADIDDAPLHCGQKMTRVIGRTHVIPDIQPYTTVAADKETKKRVHITSRKQHREFLRRNGYEEIGNEKFEPSAPKPKTDEPDVPFDIF